MGSPQWQPLGDSDLPAVNSPVAGHSIAIPAAWPSNYDPALFFADSQQLHDLHAMCHGPRIARRIARRVYGVDPEEWRQKRARLSTL